jgi:replicative DNA helicase
MELEQIPSLNDFNFINCDDEVVHIKDAVDKKDKNEKFSSGFSVFDESMQGGFKFGDLAIISGISGQGKTTLAQTLTYNLCKQGLPCIWFSYECSVEHLNSKFEEMGISDFYYAYTPKKNTTGKLDWIKAKIKEGYVKHATKFVFIDHLDFLIPTNLKTSDNQSIVLKNIATELKSLAIELKIVIVAMAHIRKIENNREPEMQDIGYSAGVFQLSDYVIMVYREKNPQYKSFSGENSGDTFTNNTIIKYVKNRATGQLKFIKCQYANGKFIEIDNFRQDDDKLAHIRY